MDELVLKAAREVLKGSEVPLGDIEWLFMYSGLGTIPTNQRLSGDVLARFRYPVAELRYRLGLPNTNALALSQQGCSGLLSMIDISRRLLLTSTRSAALCVAADFLPPGTNREVMYNVMSDAAAAVLVERDSPKNRIVYFHQLYQPFYWDTPTHENELLASYFPLAQRAIALALAGAGIKIDDVRWFVPHNVSRRSWEILAKLLGAPLERVWTDNIARVGHTVSCDHVINLVDMEKAGALERGDYLVLFTFGFGASWSCLILQH